MEFSVPLIENLRGEQRTSAPRFPARPAWPDRGGLVFPMVLLGPLRPALGVLTGGPGGSQGCALPQSHALVSRENFVLLGQMRRLSLFFCLQDRKAFRFPREMVEGSRRREAQARSVLHWRLQRTFNLLHAERASAAWSARCWASCALASIDRGKIWTPVCWAGGGESWRWEWTAPHPP